MKRKELAGKWGNALAYMLASSDNDVPLSMVYQHHLGRAVPRIRAIGSSRLITFAFHLQRPSDLRKVMKLGEEMAVHIGASNCRIIRHYSEVLVEVPLPKSLWSILPAEGLERKGGVWLTLGKTALMSPVHCKLDGHNIAPILVAGRTGAGKTEVLRLVIWELATQNEPEDLKMILMDPKRRRFAPFERLPHLAMPIISTVQDGVRAVGWLLSVLNERLESGVTHPRYVFVVDELIELMREGIVGDALGRIAQLGRECGIHMILSTQRPDRKYIDKLAAANLGLRLVGLVGDTTEATIAAGRGGTKAHLLCGGGDMLGIVADADPIRIQIALVSEKSLAKLPVMDGPPLAIALNDVNLAAMVSSNTASRPGPPPLPFTAREVAVGLMGKGIVKLRQELAMGQPRATRLRERCVGILDELGESGYNVVGRRQK